jgi:hypothetical protein
MHRNFFTVLLGFASLGCASVNSANEDLFRVEVAPDEWIEAAFAFLDSELIGPPEMALAPTPSRVPCLLMWGPFEKDDWISEEGSVYGLGVEWNPLVEVLKSEVEVEIEEVSEQQFEDIYTRAISAMDEAAESKKAFIRFSISAAKGSRRLAFVELNDPFDGWMLGLVGSDGQIGTEDVIWALDNPLSGHLGRPNEFSR